MLSSNIVTGYYRGAAMFGSAKELNRKTRWIRWSISIMLSIGSIYGSYVIWWKEDIIKTALQTPEGRQALAEAMINAEQEHRARD